MMHLIASLVAILHVSVCSYHLQSDLSSATYWTVLGILSFLAIWILEKKRRMLGLKNCILFDTDISPNHWFLGGALDFPDPDEVGMTRTWEMSVVRAMRDRHPNDTIFYLMIGLSPAVFITDAHAAESILRSSEYIDKNFGYQFLVPWLGEGVLISGGSKWKHRRRLLNPSFHYKILENYSESKYIITTRVVIYRAKLPNGCSSRVKSDLKKYIYSLRRAKLFAILILSWKTA